MGQAEQRWALSYRRYGVTMEPADAGCRSDHCFEEGGCDCGYTLAEVQAEMADHHRREADRVAAMAPDEFLRHMGYHG